MSYVKWREKSSCRTMGVDITRFVQSNPRYLIKLCMRLSFSLDLFLMIEEREVCGKEGRVQEVGPYSPCHRPMISGIVPTTGYSTVISIVPTGVYTDPYNRESSGNGFCEPGSDCWQISRQMVDWYHVIDT